jgi:hypothetical protein
MADRVDVTHESRGDLGGFDLDDFGRRVRQLAIDAHRILDRLDSSPDEVIELHRTVWCLLREAPGPQSSDLRQWLRAIREAIGLKLRTWSLEDLESLVA